MSSLEIIKQLREQTGAGMVDCKNALSEAGDDLNKAVDILRKKGIAKAAKRSGREASEGVIKLSVNEAGNEGYILEVNAETDFVALNEKFLKLSDDILGVIKEKKPQSLEELENLPLSGGTVKEVLDGLSGTVGEKMGIKRFSVLSSAGTVAAYSHLGGRIGVLVSLEEAGKGDLAYDMAMQIAAANPKYLRPEDVPAAEVDKEMEIYREQLAKEGKPENIIEKILAGKINKYYEDICLIKQEYIKDDKKKVEEVLGDVKIEGFVRYSL